MLPLVSASGSPRELGVGYGRAARKLIEQVFAWRVGEIVGRSGETEESVVRRAQVYRADAEKMVPHLIDEVEGLGIGSGLGLERAFFLQVATEVSLTTPSGCSAVGTALPRDGPVIGQNWDQPESSAGKQMMLRLRPDGNPRLLMFGHAGVVGYIGMNEAGLGHVNNQLYSTPTYGGLTQYFINRRLLECETTQEAVDWLSSIEVASTCNYLIGDASGDLADLELAGGRAHLLARGPVIAHTNHYCLDRLVGKDQYRDVVPDSSDRLSTLQAVFGSTATAEAVQLALADHRHFPVSVCRHEDGEHPSTRASILMNLRRREMSVAYGPPCQTPYRRYRVLSA